MNRLVTLFLFCLALSGCVASGVQVSQDAATQFKEGVTTEAEIVAKLGKPSSVTISGGQRFISYSGYQSQAKAASFITIIGAFAGGFDYTISSAVYQFDSQGILQKISYSQHGGAARMGAAPANVERTDPRAVK